MKYNIPMSQTLYRKYRPKNFSEIIGQTHIVRTLTNAILHNRIGQAYLFTGPRGTGKTSIARILAKTINCERSKDAVSCEKCPACLLINGNKSLDIIEIDAASNTGVDNIRELRETVALPPTALKYKVYIIDEVHMLSTGAFNALLKTLEEPPSHVIFILATTEIHKVPATIQSRCQRFDFTRLPIQNIIERLSLIAKAEKVKIESDALEMIAIAAEGGMRDAESLFNQIIALEDKNITAKEVEEILGTTDKKFVAETAELMIRKDTTRAIEKVNCLLNDGYDLQVFTKSLINYFRELMLLGVDKELSHYFSYEATKEQIDRMKKLTDMSDISEILLAINLLVEAKEKISASILPQLPLEMAIIRATKKFPSSTTRGQEPGNENRETFPSPTDVNPKPDNKNRHTFSSEKTELSSALKSSLDFDTVKSSWNRLLADIQPYNHSLKALLSNCLVTAVKGTGITIATPYDFYKDKLSEHSNRLTIEEVFGRILESKVTINIVIDKNITVQKEEASVSEPEHQQDSLLSSALEIMGGKIVE